MSRTLFLLGLLLAVLMLSTTLPVSGAACLTCVGPGGGGGTPRPTQPGSTPRPTRTRPPQGTPTAAPCTPEYDPPTITLAGHTPPYPLTIGQDPDDLGVDVTVSITGGQKNNGCNRGPAQRSITAASLREVRLSDATIRWIEGELAAYYPGAHVKDRYPLTPYYVTGGTGSTQATLTFHFDPLDPGDYEIVVNATQDDGQTQETVLSLHVWLMEATITR